MPDLPLKFVWKPVKLVNAKWRGGLLALQRTRKGGGVIIDKQTDGIRRGLKISAVYLSLRGLLLWSAGLAVVGYTAAGTTIYLGQSRQPHNQVGYLDVMAPWRWSELTRLRGATFLAQAEDAMQAGDYATSLRLLRSGIVRDPGSWEHREMLARIYVLLRVRDDSNALLLEGFDHGYPGMKRLRALHAMLAENDSPALMQRLLDRALAAHARDAGPADDLKWLHTWQIELWIDDGRWDDALSLADRTFPPDGTDHRAARLQVAVERGDHAALSRWSGEWMQTSPDDHQLLRHIADNCAKAGLTEPLDAAVRRLRALRPLDPQVIGQGVIWYLKAGMESSAQELLTDGFLWFRSRREAMEGWVTPLVAVRREDLLQRIEEVMTEQGFDPFAVRLGRLHIRLLERDWSGASVFVRQLGDTIGTHSRPRQELFSLSAALTDACLDAGGGTQQKLIALFQSSRYRVPAAQAVLEALLDTGRLATAAEVAGLAQRNYPQSVTLARLAARIAEANRQAAPAPVVLAPTKPAVDVPADVAGLLASAETLAAGGNRAEALRLIAGVRRQAPDWWDGRDTAVLSRELDWLAETGDLALLQLRVREFLRIGPQQAETLLKRAPAWRAAGHEAESLLVVREVLRRAPDDPAALALIKAWDPQPPAPAETEP